MAEPDGLVVYDEEFDRLIDQRARVYNRTIEEEFEYQAGRVLDRMIKVTPPFSAKTKSSRGTKRGGAKSATAAKRAGIAAVSRDMGKFLQPVDLKGSRRITHVFGRAVDPPIVVPTKEKWPDVAAALRHTRQGQNKSNRGRRMKLYVSRPKFDRLARAKAKNVGMLGAGYAPAAARLGVKLPAFMLRHAGRGEGSIRIDHRGGGMRIVILNAVRYADSVDGLRRRIEFAVQAQKGAMARQLDHALRKLEKELSD